MATVQAATTTSTHDAISAYLTTETLHKPAPSPAMSAPSTPSAATVGSTGGQPSPEMGGIRDLIFKLEEEAQAARGGGAADTCARDKSTY